MWFSIPRSLMKLLTLLAIFGLGVGPASAHSCVPEYLTQVGTRAKLVVLVKNLQAGVECESLNACLEEAANWRKLGFAAEAGRSVRRGIGFSPTAQLVMEHAKEGNLRATIQALLQLIREPLDAPSLGELALYARAVARSHSSSVEQEASWISIVNCSGREDPHACLELLVAE